MMKRHPNADYEDLESEYDFGNEAGTSSKRQRIQDDELWKKTKPGEVGLLGRDKARNAFDDEHARFERFRTFLLSLSYLIKFCQKPSVSTEGKMCYTQYKIYITKAI